MTEKPLDKRPICIYSGYIMAANSRFAVALHALSIIAHRADTRHTSKDIAGSVATNPVVIRRLLAELARAGIVEAAHGAKGGFRLAKPASNISLHDIRQAAEDCGSMFAQHGKKNEKCPVACRMAVILKSLFERVEAKVAPELKRTTLADIVAQLD
ncbi:MAG: Rrf2 family transcriptional regulator [Elusimicrobia bacterium CG11_big_fil_rev_8_21_14_0_20_64_6]|nr:MAG: Rrf2 family transcriptional regulator [Elusimicrobia bacterium CG11_big_fil_rev_8_21_14_0_20_64_6]